MQPNACAQALSGLFLRLSSLVSFSFPFLPRASAPVSNGEHRSATQLHLCFIGFGSQRAFWRKQPRARVDEEKQTRAAASLFLTVHRCIILEHERHWSAEEGTKQRARRWQQQQR